MDDSRRVRSCKHTSKSSDSVAAPRPIPDSGGFIHEPFGHEVVQGDLGIDWPQPAKHDEFVESGVSFGVIKKAQEFEGGLADALAKST